LRISGVEKKIQFFVFANIKAPKNKIHITKKAGASSGFLKRQNEINQSDT
jgi:hypothetical protein